MGGVAARAYRRRTDHRRAGPAARVAAGLALGLALGLIGGCLGPEEAVPPGREAVRTVPLAEPDALMAAVTRVVPMDLRPRERGLFVRRDETGAVWSASPMNGFDLTGLSWRGGRAALITDRHVVFAAHVPQPKVGGTLTFYDRDGWPITRTLARRAVLPRLRGVDLDVAVGRLDAPVPAGVAVYALPGIDPVAMGMMARGDVPVVVTFARGGKGQNDEPGWGAFASVSRLDAVTAGGARVIYARDTSALSDRQAEHAALWGDSGSASFLAQDDALLLLSHYHTSQGAGAGPNYADPDVQRLLRDAVETLDAEGR